MPVTPRPYDRSVDCGWHCTTVRPGRDQGQIVNWARLLAGHGLGPEVGTVGDGYFETREHRDLRGWRASASQAEVAVMGGHVLALVRSMHGLGICHRDLHTGNLLVDHSGRPLVIDLELACQVDPSWPCYDLYGPSSQVPVPADHGVQAATIPNGVWWDAVVPISMTSLGSVFGSVSQVAEQQSSL